MKGYGATVSPFTRKVRVAAIETGQDNLIEWEMVVMTERPVALSENNPLDKVPVVILDDGRQLYDSPVICEYLDSLHDGPKLIPRDGEARWEVLRLQALGDGVCDAAVLYGSEMRRPEAFRFQPFIERQLAKIAAGLDRFEEEIDQLDGPLTIAPIAVATGMNYMELRECMPDWREKRPRLTAWYETFCRRPSMVETAH
ncbi:MAG TPA: glutathione S-transferase [Alphaproteobacteria bacterium]|nr:glutathione S-transferase [Alphaproteobacteria bacterium]